MRGHRPRRFAALVLAIAALAAIAVARGGRGQGGGDLAAEFQRLVGGIGGGAAPDPARCRLQFDPRLSPFCPHRLGPLPGLPGACATHGVPER